MNTLVQILLVVVTTVTGYFILKEIFLSSLLGWIGAIFGLALGYTILKLEKKLKDIPLKIIIGSLTGLFVSLIAAYLFVARFLLTIMNDIPITLPICIYIFLYVVMGYLGFRIGEKKSKTIDLSKIPLFDRTEGNENVKILDTSIIIDGRIADLVETGFIGGIFVIPRFVLYEIQHIADHQDVVKRTRGKRGLEVLYKIQKQTVIKTKIVDYDFPKLQDMDTKLIALAKKLNGKIVTNGYNLHKVAEFQGIEVLNMNRLTTALKPAMLSGEQMGIQVLKEGKEHHGRGIRYLDDGAMVVVDDGRKMSGRQADIVVTSALQTMSGRMIFAKPKEQAEKEFFFPAEYNLEEQVR
ncbi:MAG: PIN domain nuclease [Syntrophobacterales bacterium]|nr:PIN domain nuclease [Syntrophobacterales bacterium]